MPREISQLKQKILLLLLGGVAFGYSYTPGRQLKVINEVLRGWRKINQEKLKQEIRGLYRSKLVDLKENSDMSFTMILTDKGKLKILKYHFQQMQVKKNKWDGKWRMVIFDIPETLKKARDALRDRLKKLGFYEFQKSVFVFPYPCNNEIEFLIEFFNLRKFVRTGILESVDNDIHLRKIFQLV